MEERRIFTEKKMIIVTLLLLLVAICGYIIFQYQDTGMRNGERAKEIEIENLAYIEEYSSFIQNTQIVGDKLNKISIFKNENDFTRKNIEKTKQDYAKLVNLKVKDGNYKAVISFFEYKAFPYFLFLFVFVLVWQFFQDECIGQKAIFYSTKNGRLGMFLWRVRALFLGISFFTVISYAGILLIAFKMYGGWNDLTNPVQSIAIFKNYIYKLSVVQFLIYYGILRIITMFVFSLVLWLGLSLFRMRKLSFILLFIVFLIEEILWNNIGEQSPYLFLKSWNLCNVLYLDLWTLSYRNIKCFNGIVNSYASFLIYTVFLGLVATIICGTILVKRRPVKEKNRLEKMVETAEKKFNVLLQKCLSLFSVTATELYKIIILEKGWIAITIWFLLMFSMLDLTPVTYYGKSAKMQEIYAKYSGDDIHKLEEYVDIQTKNVNRERINFEKSVSKYDKGLISEKAMLSAQRKWEEYDILSKCLDMTNKKIDYITEQENRYGRKVYFLNEKPYELLLKGDIDTSPPLISKYFLKFMLTLLSLLFLSSGLFFYDMHSRTEKLLYTTKNGRLDLFFKKIKIMLFISGILNIGAYCMDIYELDKVYSLTCMNAPVQSLERFCDFPISISIRTFLIIFGAMRFMISTVIGLVIIALFMNFKRIKKR